MSRPEVKEADKVIETWESAIEGTVYVWVYDRREDRYIKQPVGGHSASRRLYISRDDRKYNQEQIPIENDKLDPFTNGSLRLTASATRDETLDVRYHYTDTDLAEMFDMREEANFSEAIKAIDSELILRRLASLGEKIGTSSQNEALRELIQARYPIGGTQPSVRDMFEASDRLPSGPGRF